MRRLLCCLALGALALAAACAYADQIETQDVVSVVPWPDQERAEYRILDRKTEEQTLEGALFVERDGDRYTLNLSFSGEPGTDESTVVVDATTLKPISVRREQHADEVRIVDGEYDATEGVLQITDRSGGDERAVPLRLKDHYYDNESSLFIWRTLPFADEYVASYYTVLASQNTQLVVTLHARGKEEVTVPAGTFQCWKLEVETDNRLQVVWIADTPERPVVRYDNSRQIFELTSYEPG
jgi:hypothetical protein